MDSSHSHIDELCIRLSSDFFVIKRMKFISDIARAKIAYFPLFKTHLSYGRLACKTICWQATAKFGDSKEGSQGTGVAFQLL